MDSVVGCGVDVVVGGVVVVEVVCSVVWVVVPGVGFGYPHWEQ